ncbi:MAG: PilZ domain-containing protein [Planctomycetota bacterium]
MTDFRLTNPEPTPLDDRKTEARRQPRLKIAAMYSLVRVRPVGADRYCWTGHIYDVSLSGMRFELDEPLEPGTEIEVRGILPGQDHITFRAAGKIVRFHDDEPEMGPTRMGMVFEHFHSEVDQDRLTDYLGDHGLKIAA